MAIGAYLIVNIIGIDEYRVFCTYYPNCFNSSVKVLSYLLFWFGVVLIVFLLVYIVLMPFWILDILNDYKRYRRERAGGQLTQQTVAQTRPELAKHGLLYVQTDLDFDKNQNVYYYTPPLPVASPPSNSSHSNHGYEQIN